MQNQYQEKLLNLVSEDKLETVFALMKNYPDDGILNELIIIEGNFSNLEKSNRLNMLSFQEYSDQKDRIRKSLIDIFNKIDNEILNNYELDTREISSIIKYSTYYNLLLRLRDAIICSKPKEVLVSDKKNGTILRVVKNISIKIDKLMNFEYLVLYEHRKFVNGTYWDLKSFSEELLYRINFSIEDIHMSICDQTHFRLSIYDDHISLCIPFKHDVQEMNIRRNGIVKVRKNKTRELAILLDKSDSSVNKINSLFIQIRALEWPDLPFRRNDRPSNFVCIVQGQDILVDFDKYEPIDRLFRMNRLLSFNHQNGQVEYAKITDFRIHKVRAYLKINDKLSITHNHPVFSLQYGYIQAKALKLGMSIKTQIGFEKIYSIVEINEEVNVYDISVSMNNNFFVSNYLVHNK